MPATACLVPSKCWERMLLTENVIRPDWDEYFMEIAQIVRTRATCIRRQVGAIAVKDKRILTTGYNGAPAGLAHCSEVGCLRAEMNVPSGQRHELCRGLHAEQNTIIQAAVYGTSIKGATFYVTHQPCVVCAKMLINAGIERLVILDDYPDKLSEEMLKQAAIRVEKIRV